MLKRASIVAVFLLVSTCSGALFGQEAPDEVEVTERLKAERQAKEQAASGTEPNKQNWGAGWGVVVGIEPLYSVYAVPQFRLGMPQFVLGVRFPTENRIVNLSILLANINYPYSNSILHNWGIQFTGRLTISTLLLWNSVKFYGAADLSCDVLSPANIETIWYREGSSEPQYQIRTSEVSISTGSGIVAGLEAYFAEWISAYFELGFHNTSLDATPFEGPYFGRFSLRVGINLYVPAEPQNGGTK